MIKFYLHSCYSDYSFFWHLIGAWNIEMVSLMLMLAYLLDCLFSSVTIWLVCVPWVYLPNPPLWFGWTPRTKSLTRAPPRVVRFARNARGVNSKLGAASAQLVLISGQAGWLHSPATITTTHKPRPPQLTSHDHHDTTTHKLTTSLKSLNH